MAVLVLLPIIGAEAYLRMRHAGKPVIYYTNVSYGYAPQPMQQLVRSGNAKITIDSVGFRGAEDWKSPADKRILFIGDSVTYGGRVVDDTETFCHIAGEILEKRLGTSIVCGNAGVNGYGTDNMAERIRYPGVKDEDVIVVTLITGDTTRGLASLKCHPFFARAPRGPFIGIWEAVAVLMFQANTRMRMEGRMHHDDNVLDVTRESLNRLFGALREKSDLGKTILVVFAPLETELHGRESEHTLFVRSLLAESGFPVLDLHGYVGEHYAPGLFYDGIHLNAPGHKLYAEAIASKLASLMEPR
jgi:lysophospholipase L1-like esterase